MVPKEANHPRISPVSALSRINHGLHKARGLNLSPGVLNSAIPTFPPKCSNFLVFQVNSHLLCKLVPPKPGWPDCTRLSNSLAKKKKEWPAELTLSVYRVLPRVQLVPAPPVPDASSLSLSLFLDGPAGSGFAPEKSKNSWAVQD